MRLLFVLGAVLLGGCVGISEEVATQLDEVGDVEVASVVCASGANAACPAGNDGRPAGGGEYQLLVGYRIPAAAAPPESLVAREGTLTLSRSGSFTAELERLAPPAADAGRRWVGYVSPPFDFTPSQTEQSVTIVARMMLTRAGDGSPFAGPFRFRTIVGYRAADPDGARPVQCGETLSAPADGGRCMDFPSEDELASELSIATRDLGILTGPAGSVRRGGTGSIPFTVAYAGESPSPPWALAVSTTVPGATVTAPATIAPQQAGPIVVPVSIAVPASAPPGRYEVALSATHRSGQFRRAAGLVTVTGTVVDRTPPELAVRMRTRPRIRRARRIGVVADVACSEACRLSAQLRHGDTVVGRFTERRTAAGRRNVRVRFFRGYGARLARTRRVTLTLRVEARDPAGNARRRTIRFALRR